MAEHIQGYNDNTPAYVEFNTLYITSVISKSVMSGTVAVQVHGTEGLPPKHAMLWGC